MLINPKLTPLFILNLLACSLMLTAQSDKHYYNHNLSTKDTSPILLSRNFVGSEATFSIDPDIENQMTKIVWENNPNANKQFINRIVQIAPNILLYNEYNDSLSNVLYSPSQPTKIEFLDSSFQINILSF